MERHHLQVLTSRIQEPRKFIQVLMGPRQTGKTTLALQLLKKLSIPGKYEPAGVAFRRLIGRPGKIR